MVNVLWFSLAIGVKGNAASQSAGVRGLNYGHRGRYDTAHAALGQPHQRAARAPFARLALRGHSSIAWRKHPSPIPAKQGDRCSRNEHSANVRGPGPAAGAKSGD